MFCLPFSSQLIADFLENVETEIAGDFLVEVITMLQSHTEYHETGTDELPMAASQSAALLLNMVEELNLSAPPEGPDGEELTGEMYDEFYDNIYELLDRFAAEGEINPCLQEICVTMGDVTHAAFSWKAYPDQGIIQVRF